MRIFLTLYVIFALNFNIAFAAPSFSIEPQKDIYFVDDNIEFRIVADGNDYLSDIFWRNSENDNWQKIVRISPEITSLNWTIPYITNKSINFKIESSLPKNIETIWTNDDAHSVEIRSAVFSEDMKYIVSASDNHIKIWDWQQKEMVFSIETNEIDRIRHVLPVADSDRLIIATISGVFIFDRSSGIFKPILNNSYEITVRRMTLSENGNLLAFGDQHANVYLYDIQNDTLLHTFKLGDNPSGDEIYSIDITSSGDSLICGTYSGYLYLIDANSGAVNKFGRHADENMSNTVVFDVKFSKCGLYVFSCGADATIRKWALSDYSEQAIYNSHTFHVRSIAIEDELLISASLDGKLILWDIETAYKHKEVEFGSQVVFADYSNGYLIASGRNGSFVVYKISASEMESFYTDLDAFYKINVFYDDIIGVAGSKQIAYLNVEHSYRSDDMPYDEFMFDIYADYPANLLYWGNESTVGKIRYTHKGSIVSGIADAVDFLLLKGDTDKGNIAIDSIISISPDVYYFAGIKSDVNIIDYCPSNSDKFLSYDREPNFNIFLNNKTLGIDVLFVEDGQYNIMLYDVGGSLVRIMAEGRFNHGKHNFYEHINDFANGIYFVVIETPSGEIKVRKILF